MLIRKLTINTWKNHRRSGAGDVVKTKLASLFGQLFIASVQEDFDFLYEVAENVGEQEIPAIHTRAMPFEQFLPLVIALIRNWKNEKVILYFSQFTFVGFLELQGDWLIVNAESVIELAATFEGVVLRCPGLRASIWLDYTPPGNFDCGYDLGISGRDLVVDLYPLVESVVQNVYNWSPPALEEPQT